MPTIAEQIQEIEESDEPLTAEQTERLVKALQVVRLYEKLQRERAASKSKPILTPANSPVYAAALALLGGLLWREGVISCLRKNFEQCVRAAMATAAAKPAAFAITEEVKKKAYEPALVIRREAVQQNEGGN